MLVIGVVMKDESFQRQERRRIISERSRRSLTILPLKATNSNTGRLEDPTPYPALWPTVASVDVESS